MTNTTILFLITIALLSLILLTINFIFAPHNAYQEKNSTFECGFHSFLGQNRTQFNISFFIFALLFLLFDLEILLIYPYSVSAYNNDIYGLITMLIFFLVLTLGFAFELGKNALNIDTRQIITVLKEILRTILKKSLLKLFYYSQFFIIFIVIYSVCNIIVIILIKIGIINLPFSLIDLSGPLCMNTEPLDHYPEYKQINNIQEGYNVQQQLFNIKQDIETKLLFNKPECYKEIAISLRRTFHNNIDTVFDPSKLHPLVNHARQVDSMARLHEQMIAAEKDYLAKVELFNTNQRNLAECNHRIIAISTRIYQLGGFNSNS
jgi:NADH-ubiquinone oxidoreductase chain 3